MLYNVSLNEFENMGVGIVALEAITQGEKTMHIPLKQIMYVSFETTNQQIYISGKRSHDSNDEQVSTNYFEFRKG